MKTKIPKPVKAWAIYNTSGEPFYRMFGLSGTTDFDLNVKLSECYGLYAKKETAQELLDTYISKSNLGVVEVLVTPIKRKRNK